MMKKTFSLSSISVFSLLLSVSLAEAQDAPDLREQTTAQEPDENIEASSKSSVPPVEDEIAALLNRPGGLTADEAARQAAAYTREAVVAQEDYKYAKAKKNELIYGYTPRVTLTASYTRQSIPDSQLDFSAGGNLVATTAPPGPVGPADPLIAVDGSAFNFNPLPNNWYLNAGVVIPISDYLLNLTQAVNGAEAATESAKLNERAARLNAAANARLSYYEWVRSRLRVKEAEDSSERAADQLEDLKRLREAGRAARADVLRQDAFLASQELNVRRAATNEAISRENLYVMMVGGSAGETPRWEIGEDVLGDHKDDELALADVTDLQKEAVAHRLEIKALDQTAYAIRQQRSVQKTQGYPRIEGFGNVTYANPNPRYVPPTNAWNGSWDLGVRMVWTLNDLGTNYSAARALSADEAKVNAQKQQIADALRTEVLTAHRSIIEARLARESARRGVLAAEAAYEDRLQLFENGRGTTLDVLQSESALLTARLDLIDAYIALRQARVRLDHAVGWDVQDAAPEPEER